MEAQNQLTLSPQVAAAGDALVLSGSGEMQRRQLEFTARIGAHNELKIANTKRQRFTYRMLGFQVPRKSVRHEVPITPTAFSISPQCTL
jgi:hypothetical protein